MQIHGLYAPASADTAAPGQWAVGIVFDLANNAILDEVANESIVIDGENYRLLFDLRFGIGDGFEASLAVPLVAHRAGVFDHFIWEWHDTFGLSNDRRAAFEHDELRFSYVRDGEELIAVERDEGGIGDVRLGAAWRLGATAPGARAMSVHAGVKLPTGDEDDLLGSGSTDLSLMVAGADPVSLGRWNASLFWTAGILRLGGGGPLDAVRKEWVPTGSLGATWPPFGNRFTLKAQLDAHGAFYRSDLRAFGAASVQLVTGFGLDLGDAGQFDLALIENVHTDATPDFGLHFVWRSLL